MNQVSSTWKELANWAKFSIIIIIVGGVGAGRLLYNGVFIPIEYGTHEGGCAMVKGQVIIIVIMFFLLFLIVEIQKKENNTLK